MHEKHSIQFIIINYYITDMSECGLQVYQAFEDLNWTLCLGSVRSCSRIPSLIKLTGEVVQCSNELEQDLNKVRTETQEACCLNTVRNESVALGK